MDAAPDHIATHGFAGRRVLVTGAGGFIGSHLVGQLVSAGARVSVFLRYTSRPDFGLLGFLPPDAKGSLEVHRGDLRDEDAIHQAMKGKEIVFHLGALIAIPYSYLHPREVVETNVLGTLNVLMAARAHGLERLVHASTSEVYGSALNVPMDESHPLQGQSPYAASKIGADKLVESFAKSFGVPAVTVRPFNTYGPRQSARAVIPSIISQALVKDEVAIGDTTTKRDFTYATDTAAGFLRAAVGEGLAGETIHLGTGQAVTIGDLAAEILKIVGRPVRLKSDPERFRPADSEVRHLLSDNTKARRLLGWEPKVSLQEGLAETVAWVRNHPDHFDPDRYTL